MNERTDECLFTTENSNNNHSFATIVARRLHETTRLIREDPLYAHINQISCVMMMINTFFIESSSYRLIYEKFKSGKRTFYLKLQILF